MQRGLADQRSHLCLYREKEGKRISKLMRAAKADGANNCSSSNLFRCTLRKVRGHFTAAGKSGNVDVL